MFRFIKNIDRVIYNLGNSGRTFVASKSWSKAIVALCLTLAVLTGLFFSTSPVKAVSVNLVNLPSTMTASSNYTFTSQVTINANENIPIDSIRLDLTGPTNAYAVFNPDGTITGQSDQFVSVVQQGTPSYSEGSRSGYGYGFSSGSNTLDLAINTWTDETGVYNDGTNWVWDLGDIDDSIGNFTPETQKFGSGLRFANVNIPQGATITYAYLTFTSRTDESGTVTRSVIVGDKETDAAAFSNLADYQSRLGKDVGGADNTKRTSVQVTWDKIGPWQSGNQYQSPDISSVIQEIVDQPGWTSGNHLALFWDDHEGRSDPGAAREAFTYLKANTESAKLHIVYGSAGTGSYQTSWGYGSGYSGPTTLQYKVTIDTTGMGLGAYTAQMSVNVPIPVDSSITRFLSSTYSFNLTAASTGGGGGGGGSYVPVSYPVSLNLLTGNPVILNSSGITMESAQLTTMDGNIILNIPSGTTLLDTQGQRLTMLSAAATLNLPSPPAGCVVISSIEFGPRGATFNPALNVSFKYDPASLPAGVSGSSLYIAWWDGTAWQQLVSTVDSQNKVVTAGVSHFTSFALIGVQTPVTTTPTTTPISTTTVTTITTSKTTTTIPTTSPSTTTSTSTTTTLQMPTRTLTPITTPSTVSTSTTSKTLFPVWSWIVIGAGVFVIALVILIWRRSH